MFSPRQVAYRLRERADLIEDAVPVKLGTVREIQRRTNLGRFSVGPQGQAIIASTDAATLGSRNFSAQSEEVQQFQRTGWPVHIQVFQKRSEEELHFNYPLAPSQLIQPLPDGRHLIVNGRVDRDDPQPNATVIDENGDPTRSFLVGDNVSCMRTTNEGDIWISYGDEGTTSNNFGEANGITRWTLDGVRRWPPGPPPIGWSNDWVDGFNLVNETVWIRGEVSIDRSGVVSARSVPTPSGFGVWVAAVAGPWSARVHSAERDLVELVNFSDPEQPQRVFALATPEGRLVPADSPVDVLADTLNYLVDDRWMSITIEQLLDAETVYRRKQRFS